MVSESGVLPAIDEEKMMATNAKIAEKLAGWASGTNEIGYVPVGRTRRAKGDRSVWHEMIATDSIGRTFAYWLAVGDYGSWRGSFFCDPADFVYLSDPTSEPEPSGEKMTATALVVEGPRGWLAEVSVVSPSVGLWTTLTKDFDDDPEKDECSSFRAAKAYVDGAFAALEEFGVTLGEKVGRTYAEVLAAREARDL